MSSKRRPSSPHDDPWDDGHDDRRDDEYDDHPDEVTTVARDPHRTGRLLRVLPLVLAALVSVPLLWLAIAFSLEMSQVAVYIMQLGAGGWTQFGVILMSVGGFICLVAALVCLFIGWRRDTWRWRWSWAGATVFAAGFMPLMGIVTGVFWG